MTLTADWSRIFRGTPETGPKSLDGTPRNWSKIFRWSGPVPRPAWPARLGPNKNQHRKKTQPPSRSRERPSASRPKAGLLVAVDLQELLTNQGIPRNLAARLVAQKDPEAVAKVLLNAFYLQSQGKLQNGPGYIRAGSRTATTCFPRSPTAWKDAAASWRSSCGHRITAAAVRQADQKAAEEAAIVLCARAARPRRGRATSSRQAVAALPEPLVRRNPTLSNPFVRGKVYELACGEPVDRRLNRVPVVGATNP